MKLRWHYKPTEPFFSQGKDTTRSNFSREERTQVGILVREALQNPLDIKREDTQDPVRVSMKLLNSDEFDAYFVEQIFTPEFRKRLKASSDAELPPAREAQVLVIEDFGTKGLIGDTDDYNADGPDQNWNAFWHREGEGAKGRASNGGAGQGKITYYNHSYASTVLGLTQRSTDMRTLLMGRASFLRDYKYSNGKKYYRACYWTKSSDGPTPEEQQSEIARFIKAFNLSRNPKQTGLSLVIPFAKTFDQRDALKSVVLDFYVPIIRGHLEVTVGKRTLNADSIDQIASENISDADVAELGSSFSKAYRSFIREIITTPPASHTLSENWNRERTIPTDAFPEASIEQIRRELEAGRTICINLPLKLKRKASQQIQTHFSVYIAAPADLQRNEEAFIRRDLLIGNEKHLTAGSFVQRTRSLTWIQDKDLSDFLLTAEEPTHLAWNASLARDKGEYTSPDIALRSIRQAVPRILTVLLAASNQRDTKSLSQYFPRPTRESTQQKGKSGARTVDANTTNPEPKPPQPNNKPIKIDPRGNFIRVYTSDACPLQPNQLPLQINIELAYEGLDHDPFAAYDPFDFDLANRTQFTTELSGANLIEVRENRIRIDVIQPKFELKITGFDPNIRTRVRATFDFPGSTDNHASSNT